jgi:hypothetical protein
MILTGIRYTPQGCTAFAALFLAKAADLVDRGEVDAVAPDGVHDGQVGPPPIGRELDTGMPQGALEVSACLTASP